MGHDAQSSALRLSDRYRFDQGTFAATRANGRDAPRAAARRSAGSRPSSVRA